MREQHDTKMLEQAVQAIAERLSAPARQLNEASARKNLEVGAQAEAVARSAEAAARGSILLAESWKAVRILASVALVIVAIGIAGRMIVSALVPKVAVTEVAAVAAAPVGPVEPTAAPKWPPVPSAGETTSSGNNIVTTNYTLFRKTEVRIGASTFEVTAGHEYQRETDTDFTRAWCYTEVVPDDVNLTITLGAKTPGKAPYIGPFTASQSKKSGISQAAFKKLFENCPWIDGNPDITTQSSNPTTFRFDQNVTKASVDALVDALANGAMRIELASGGGDLDEGIRGLEAIRKAGASTVATGDCASACTLLFLGGSERSLGAEGRIGVHQWRTELGVASEVEAQLVSAKLLSLFATAGVTEQFYIAGAATTPEEIYWLTEGDLKSWHVVTEPSTKG